MFALYGVTILILIGDMTPHRHSATVHCNKYTARQGGFEHIYEASIPQIKKICSMNSKSATQYPGYFTELCAMLGLLGHS